MPEIKQDIRGMTLVVASPTSLHANDADYVCNGTPSQNAQTIQDAMNLCALVGGGTVKILEGEILLDHRPGTTYSVIAMKANVHLKMSPGTILKLADGAVGAGDTGHPIIDTYDEATLTFVSNFRISGGVIDGNKANQNPTVQTSMNIGIWIRQVTTVAGHRAIFLDNITIHDTVSAGFYFEEVFGAIMNHQNVFGTNLVAYNTGLVAVLTTVGGFHFDTVSHVHLTDCYAFDNYSGIVMVDAHYNKIKGFKSYSNTLYGLRIYRAASTPSHNEVEIFSVDDEGETVHLEGVAGNELADNVITGESYASVAQTGNSQIYGRYLKRCNFHMKVDGVNVSQNIYIRDASEGKLWFHARRGLNVGASFSTNFINNIIEGIYELNLQNGLQVGGGSTYNTIVGVQAKDNSQQTNNTYSEIRSDGTYNTFVGCVMRSTQANKARNGYREYSGDYNRLINCIALGAVTVQIGYPGQVNELGANTIAYNQHVDHFQDVLAADANHVRAAEDLSVAVPITFTIDAQPDVPRTISWTMTHVNITAFTLVITGYTSKGQYIAEPFTEAGGWAGETSNAFAVISSIQLTARTGTGVGDTMDVGIGSKLGLANRIYATAHVIKVQKNGAHYPAASYTVNATYDTVDVSTGGAIVVGDDFSIWYRACMNIIG